MIEVGETFAEKYVVLRHLASGGMGAVYVVEHAATGEELALKVLWPQTLTSAKAVKSFMEEARMAARIRSRHVVKTYDAGYDKQRRVPYLVMELLDGCDLEEKISRDGPMSPERCLSYLAQVCDALSKAHSYRDKQGVHRAIIHRDLKPENLFLAEDERGEQEVKILDFGLAKVTSASQEFSQDIKGSPLFMAWEQSTGKPVSARTDIWALGLIAFYLLSGRHYWLNAYTDAPVYALLTELVNGDMPTASERLAERDGIAPPPWPVAFDDWFRRCVNRDVQARYATVEECLAGLSEALGPDAGDLPAFSLPKTTLKSNHLDDTAFAEVASGDMHYSEADPSKSETAPALSSETPVKSEASEKQERSLAVPLLALAAALTVAAAAVGVVVSRSSDKKAGPGLPLAKQPASSANTSAPASASPPALPNSSTPANPPASAGASGAPKVEPTPPSAAEPKVTVASKKRRSGPKPLTIPKPSKPPAAPPKPKPTAAKPPPPKPTATSAYDTR